MKKNKTHLSQSYAQSDLVWLIKIGHLLTKQLNRSLVNRFDLTFNQVSILFLVHVGKKFHGKDLTLQELANHFMVSLPNVNARISRLQQDGFLQKSIMPHDRRVHCVQLTPKGKHILRTIKKDWPPDELQALDRFFYHLPSKQRKIFVSILRDVALYLKKEHTIF